MTSLCNVLFDAYFMLGEVTVALSFRAKKNRRMGMAALARAPLLFRRDELGNLLLSNAQSRRAHSTVLPPPVWALLRPAVTRMCSGSGRDRREHGQCSEDSPPRRSLSNSVAIGTARSVRGARAFSAADPGWV
jgi:hypothetical protein